MNIIDLKKMNFMTNVLSSSKIIIFFLFLSGFVIGLSAQVPDTWKQIVGSAFLENQSYDFLRKLSDQAGPRLAGTPENAAATQIIRQQLTNLGYEVRLEKFKMPGWVRKIDRVDLVLPSSKSLKVVSLGYTVPTAVFRAPAVYAGQGFSEDYKGLDASGKIVLISSDRLPEKPRIQRQEAIEQAIKQGAKALLFINERSGNLNRAGSGDFHGNPLPIPVFSITREEGLWIKRLLSDKINLQLEVETASYIEPIEVANIVAELPGKNQQKIVVGAHFDAWDLAQGSIDNGLGTAILFDVARLLKNYSPQNYYSVEFVWFNAEELGLFGSKNYIKVNNPEKILLMINMDMTGSPTGINAMGFDELVPALHELVKTLNGFNLHEGVSSRPWTNSDHMPFMFRGIPIITLRAKLDENMLSSYHSQMDTFDKVNKKYLSEAAAVVSILAQKFANSEQFRFPRKTQQEMISLFKKYQLDERLKIQKEWPFQSD